MKQINKFIRINKYILYSLILMCLLSFAQFIVSTHNICEGGHSHHKRCPLHKNCCSLKPLNSVNAAAAECENLLPALLLSGTNKPDAFFFIEALFCKTIFHPPNLSPISTGSIRV